MKRSRQAQTVAAVILCDDQPALNLAREPLRKICCLEAKAIGAMAGFSEEEQWMRSAVNEDNGLVAIHLLQKSTDEPAKGVAYRWFESERDCGCLDQIEDEFPDAGSVVARCVHTAKYRGGHCCYLVSVQLRECLWATQCGRYYAVASAVVPPGGCSHLTDIVLLAGC